MNAVDLYQLTRVRDIELFTLYEKILSSRQENIKMKSHEMDSLISLVEVLSENNIGINGLRNYYFQYEIPQIGKEFDLLRISDEMIINIELKSRDVGAEKIKKQLIKNKRYLSHLSRKIVLITFDASIRKFYYLADNEKLEVVCINNIVEWINSQTCSFSGDVNSLFRVSDFLVSPLNTPLKFINEEYFLTPQQQENKDIVLERISSNYNNYMFFGITGGPGTGKTLTLYDIAHHYAKTEKVCIIHCGMLSRGHCKLKHVTPNLDIFSAKEYDSINFLNYRYVFVDESHRFYDKQFNDLINTVKSNKLVCVFGYDHRQVLSKAEVRRDLVNKISKLPDIFIIELSNKIRTNKEIASFIRRLLNIHHNDIQPRYPSVSIVYANNTKEAHFFIKEFEKMKMVIHLTQVEKTPIISA